MHGRGESGTGRRRQGRKGNEEAREWETEKGKGICWESEGREGGEMHEKREGRGGAKGRVRRIEEIGWRERERSRKGERYGHNEGKERGGRGVERG